MLNLTSIRQRLPAVPSIPFLATLSPWLLLLIPFLGGLHLAYSVLKLASPPKWYPGISNLSEVGTKVKEGALDEEKGKEFDIILVGSGTTGCVLASRLSEDPNISVLVLEAGKAGVLQLFSRIPATFARLFPHPTAEWGYDFAPSEGTKGRSLRCPRARMLGGCSSINAMMCHHCSPSDFDEIASLGFPSFSSASLEPYFAKSQSHIESTSWPLNKPDDKASVTGTGPVKTGYSWINELCLAFVHACGAVGMEVRADLNDAKEGKGTLGATRTKTFIEGGSRVSAATAYLTPDVIARPNLTVSVGATVTRILFSNSTPPRATGVEFTSLDNPWPTITGKPQSRTLYRASARKEVILTAGVIGSPHILKVSGVGPREELEKVGVPVLVDAPEVGGHLKDHLSVGMAFVAKKGVSSQWVADPLKGLPPLVEWLKHKTGPLTSNIAESLAFVRSTDKEFAERSGLPAPDVEDLGSGGIGPDIELIDAPLVFAKHGTVHPPPNAGATDFYSIAPILLRPKSHGTVTIVSKDVFVKPVIDAQFFSDPHDVKLLTWGLKLCYKVANTEPLASLLLGPFQPNHPSFPEFVDVVNWSDEKIEDYIRGHAEVLYHPIGTVSLGRCLDGNLKVHGTASLRVCDASIFPEQISGHPMAPLLAIAERFAEELKGELKGLA
ncbi:hypothetical protein BCR35DRAFT_309616 [Leucosporidium creatinivorum]|uniref:GMC oxidoreductase n=1 Tax=Leucosporidium creatinivorum TaxID=106004 RepID=A0A1Y2DF08_9BASI|nr:hypothetical protein BCR35DRAFT_309616 [Leucosporidium creatinivorum]